MVVYLTEIVPAEVRASGFSLAYSLATALGGFTPFIVTWLIGRTGNRADARRLADRRRGDQPGGCRRALGDGAIGQGARRVAGRTFPPAASHAI